MSFGTYARKVRDPALPLAHRVGALRSAVVLYQPLGWHLTLRVLDQAVGGYARSEQALLRALELLEESRQQWLTEVRAYARDRRAAKARGSRGPRSSDRNPFSRPTGWRGPLRAAASLHALAVWRTRLSEADPLEREAEALVTACLAAGGRLTPEQRAALANTTVELARRVRSAAARGDNGGHFRAMIVLRVVDLVATAAAPADDAAKHVACHDGGAAAAWEALLEASRIEDEHRSDRSRSWVPPIMSAFVAAAMSSALRRLFPFTSHNLLRFSRSQELGMWHNEDVAPAFVAVVPGPDRYVVFSGAPETERWNIVVETPDPAVAVAEAERLLSGWP